MKGSEIVKVFLAGYMDEVGAYMEKALEMTSVVLATLCTVISYILFPTDAYIPAVIALSCAVVLDIITKYYALSVTNGGLRNALQTKAISSNKLWTGTQRKLVSYLVIMVLCGLSVRVTTLTDVAVFLSTSAFSIMFLREAQSCVENLVDAGNTDLMWVSSLLKRKREEVKEEVIEKTTKKEGD